MREAKKDTKPERMANDFTSSDGLASVMQTCMLPLLSLVGLLNLLGVTSFGWNAYSGAFWIILFISFVPEFFGMRYITPKDRG